MPTEFDDHIKDHYPVEVIPCERDLSPDIVRFSYGTYSCTCYGAAWMQDFPVELVKGPEQRIYSMHLMCACKCAVII